MRTTTFLLQFQERNLADSMSKTNQLPRVLSTGTETATFTREERDQDRSSLSGGTRTMTEGREENDQDRSVLMAGTLTDTRAREELDQDLSNYSYNVLPRC